MDQPEKHNPQRVLIASSHELFGQGLRSLLQGRPEADVEIVGMVSNLEEAVQAIEDINPDLVIVDYDDENLNREEFLVRFVEGEKKLRVVLLSLHDGEEALIYDRRTLAAAQIDDWLEEWKIDNKAEGIHDGNSDSVASEEKKNRRSNMKHLIIAGILVVIVSAILLVGLQLVDIFPISASAQAIPIDFMFNIEFTLIAFLFSLIVVFMVYSIIVFRRKKGDTTDAAYIEGNTRLEVVWTIIPLATVLFLAYMGANTLAATQAIDPQSLEVEVIGSQWSWRFEYPDLGITSDELHLPINKQALLLLSSTDVIHSFWVPEFRVKQDALPGGEEFVRELRITPTELGEYKIRCAELCGLQHTYMLAPVIVETEEDFAAWVASEVSISDDPVERGSNWVEAYGCLACHSIDGSESVGPTWKGVYQSERTFNDGLSIVANEDYLLKSIHEPSAQIVEGFADIMPPNIAADMTDEQISDVIEFIKSLR